MMYRGNEFAAGIKHAVRLICVQLEVDAGRSYEAGTQNRVTEDWFGHHIARNGECDCLLVCETNDEVILARHWYVRPCPSWADDTYRRAWHCEWYGITLEQLAAREKAELEASQMDDKVARRQRVADAKALIERELADQGVVITLPPH